MKRFINVSVVRKDSTVLPTMINLNEIIHITSSATNPERAEIRTSDSKVYEVVESYNSLLSRLDNAMAVVL